MTTVGLNKLKDILAIFGYKYRFITEEEHEDGIGACAGHNFVKDQVWYTVSHACHTAGYSAVRTGWAQWELEPK